MRKLRNKKNSKRPHISYKYIITFCATFAICNSFVENYNFLWYINNNLLYIA